MALVASGGCALPEAAPQVADPGAGEEHGTLLEDAPPGPAGLRWHDNYPEAFEAALGSGRPLFLVFTGVTCVNSKRMEADVLPMREVKDRLEQVERAYLWVDKPPHGDFNKELQYREFHSRQQPQYVLIDPRDGVVLRAFHGYNPFPQMFADFLQDGLDSYAARTPAGRAEVRDAR